MSSTASVFHVKLLFAVSPRDSSAHCDTHLKSYVRRCQHILPYQVPRNKLITQHQRLDRDIIAGTDKALASLRTSVGVYHC
ncbi:hypothetical protein CEXT_116961 [Caerostris extrusa]|uniref:Uncharacterized protein n=1 Tax=Caerostris extrusa TaxID=172846 RepID=A0AAV4Y0G0_CAEEX|nr:hypothetical protein CEXT_116961 [Caerostris extrusa]